jgi:CxxC motif-containing protein (DUF1111 family)
MRRIIAMLLCMAVPACAFASDPNAGYKVAYDGGSLPGVKTGQDVRLQMDQKQIMLVKGKDAPLVAIPVASVTEISYGQDVHRRVGAAIGVAVFTLGLGALLALTKSKKHFIGITWADGDKKGGFVLQCDKNEYRGILTSLEGITGKKAIDSEAMTVKN